MAVTIYCVQAYWRDGRKLAQGVYREFDKEADARRAGEKAYANHAGVIVYAKEGEPEFDVWREPRLVAAFGETPALEV